MSKEWRIVQLSPLITFGRSPEWVVSRRKLSDDEIKAIRQEEFTYDFYDELGICGDGCLIIGVVTMPGATRAQAIKECNELNNGKRLFEDMFKWDDEEEGDGQSEEGTDATE